KDGNRRCERLLREAELWWTMGGDVPDEVAAELDELWKEVLLQQFHDIIPGSSIAWVHADAEAAHERVGDRLEALVAAAFERLQLPSIAVANVATRPRREVVTLDDPPDDTASSQQLSSGSWASMVEVAGSAIEPLRPVAAAGHMTVTEHSLSNGLVCVQWDLDGTIVSIIDVEHGRELLPTARGITVELAPDHPVEYDAWDLESWTLRQGAPIGPSAESSVEVVERGPLVCSARVIRPFGRSRLELTYTLRAGSPRLDITIDVDWHEDEHLLSIMVPLDVRADVASCGIQFGHVERPTHPSSPWDAAKFEVCAHRYVDVSEPSFGVAVLDDGRYGHSLFDGGVRVSLLRAAKFPDPDADHGRHRTTIAVLPHGPGLHEVLAEAEALSYPLRVVAPTSPGSGTFPPPTVTIDHPGVELSAVKRADDASGDLIVRLYEACGDRSAVTVRTAGRVMSADRCNLLEEPQGGIEVGDGHVALTLRPFELVTLRLVVA
ncbi:MAG: alpha-mannosidase, partial [Ilumatobacteraceae bacterium]